MKRHALRAGEPMAIDSSAIHRDADGFYIVVGDAAPENETRGEVTIVNVRGALCQYKGDGGDSYEGIQERVKSATEADPKPTSILLRVDSPGGVVAGLNECVDSLRRIAKDAEIPLVAYIPAMAASAAFAICCACSERLAHESAIVGSVGVVSTMVSVAARDAAEGIEYRLITSGKRKADGHLHAPISDDAEKAERGRNDELARQFFALASRATGLSPAKLDSLEAGIFLGGRAKKVGLIDDVSTLDEVLYGLGATVVAGDAPAPNGGNVTDRRAKNDAAGQKPLDSARHRASRSTAQHDTPREDSMGVKLSALIRRTEAALAEEVDPKAQRVIQAKLSALLVAKAEMDDDDGDDDDKPKKDDDDDGDDSAAEKHAARAAKLKAKAKANEHRAKAAEHKSKAAEEEENAKKCEEEGGGGDEEARSGGSEEEEAKAALALVRQMTGMTGARALGAVQAAFETVKTVAVDVAALKTDRRREKQEAAIGDALRANLITRSEATFLGSQTLATVEGFVELRRKSGVVVHTDDSTTIRPRAGGKPGSEASLPPDVIKFIDDAVAMAGVTDTKALRAALVEKHVAEQAKGLNGAGGRY